MPTYPRIKLIPDIIDKDEITVREGDLVDFNSIAKAGIAALFPEDPVRIMYTDGIIIAEIRAERELKGKAIFLNTMIGDPKIVTDSEGQTCLIFIRRHYD